MNNSASEPFVPGDPRFRGTHREPGEPGKLYRPDVYLELLAGMWGDSIALAVAGDMSFYHVSREEALRRLGETLRDEIRRDNPATLRIARALREG